MAKLKKQDRLRLLREKVLEQPFLTDEELAQHFNVSIQTIRLDRIELNIPEVRTRIKQVAEVESNKIKSLSLQEMTGEIIDIVMNEYALSLLHVEENHLFMKYNIARGQYLFAQANSLCVAVLDYPVVLTKHANISFVRQARLGEQVISKATVSSWQQDSAIVNVTSKVNGVEIFNGEFEMYFRNEGD